jgi:hypothetical protein
MVARPHRVSLECDHNPDDRKDNDEWNPGRWVSNGSTTPAGGISNDAHDTGE